MIKCISYNCNSVRNNEEIVKILLNDCDILFLQELMLLKSDVPFLDSLSNEYDNVACVNDRESMGIVEGRPARGVAILWKKSLSTTISPLIIDDSLIGIIVTSGNNKVLMLNCYMPCDKQNFEALHAYRSYLAKLNNVIEEQNVNDVIVAGDCNADPSKGRFWRELTYFKETMSFACMNEQLPQNTFTYLCPARNTTSWLDHILCSKNIANSISDIYVNYEVAFYDHLPVCFNVKINVDREYVQSDPRIRQLVYWNKISESNKLNIKSFLDDIISKYRVLEAGVFFCKRVNCKKKDHLNEIDNIFLFIKKALHEATEDYSAEKTDSFKIVPGWNRYVKIHYTNARDSFLIWKNEGKPIDGIFLENMKSTRRQFKQALEFCRVNEETIRNEMMIEKLESKDYKGLWNEVDKIRKAHVPLVNRIDGECDPKSMVDIFSGRYKVIFDKFNIGRSDAEDVEINLDDIDSDDVSRVFTKDDIHKGINELCHSIGPDGIHSNHLKLATDLFKHLIALLFNAYVLHGYMSLDVLRGTIGPTVKDRYGDLHSSDNYRPVMSSSVFLKLFEYCILRKVGDCFNLNDRQHSFRKNCSTSSACLVLKETLHRYLSSNSCVYACFLDISKAFDSVKHSFLIKKLIAAGVPSIFINIIKYWYSNQFVNVRFGTKYSEEWKLCNGVRQGGVLSGIFFNIYINSLIENVANTRIGCKIGSRMSNIITYADDIVLLAPSYTGLQKLIDISVNGAISLNLVFNESKSKCMIFRGKLKKIEGLRPFTLNNKELEFVSSFKYLGYFIQENLNNSIDIDHCLRKFYKEFNIILRKFSFADSKIKLYLLKQCCLQIYGSDLWFCNKGSMNNLKQFGIAYHKAIKKILCLSSHESNHFACEIAKLMTFEHFLNSNLIFFAYRMLEKPCNFIRKVKHCFQNSYLLREVYDILGSKYEIDSLLENDKDAIKARISYVQNHEPQMREGWN